MLREHIFKEQDGVFPAALVDSDAPTSGMPWTTCVWQTYPKRDRADGSRIPEIL